MPPFQAVRNAQGPRLGARDRIFRGCVATDKQVAAAIYQALSPALARPVSDWLVQHTRDHHLLRHFYKVNSIHRVNVLEEQNRLLTEDIRNGVDGSFRAGLRAQSFS